MVWIHGGGFAAGAGSEPRYTNSALVSKKVVLVTINYRLGVFGFFANEDLLNEGHGHAGNYGLMDMARRSGGFTRTSPNSVVIPQT
jgi:para-nitrobenzyl esterase